MGNPQNPAGKDQTEVGKSQEIDETLRAHRQRIGDYDVKTAEEIEKQVVPGRIVQMSGRPVRFTVSGPLGVVRATMVEEGFYPPSATGFYSITYFGLSIWKGEIRREEVLDVIEQKGAASFLPERKEYTSNGTRGLSGYRKARALIGGGAPAWANEILTRPVKSQDEIIRDGLELVRRGVEVARKDVLPLAKRGETRWAASQIQKTIDSGKETLRMLEKADRTSLFGQGDLESMIDKASVEVRKAYGGWNFEGRVVSEEAIRAHLRQTLQVDVLKERHMPTLREKIRLAFGEG